MQNTSDNKLLSNYIFNRFWKICRAWPWENLGRLGALEIIICHPRFVAWLSLVYKRLFFKKVLDKWQLVIQGYQLLAQIQIEQSCIHKWKPSKKHRITNCDLQAFQGFLMGKSFKNDWKYSRITVCYQRFFACIFIYFYPHAKTFVKFGLHASVAVPNNHPLEDFLEDLIINSSLLGVTALLFTHLEALLQNFMDPQNGPSKFCVSHVVCCVFCGAYVI